jgi:4a-hydroxytetrahydrobiopterin dehydratase
VSQHDAALHQRHPAELPKGTPALDPGRVTELKAQLDQGWRVEPASGDAPDALARDFEFRDFRDAFGFATRVALVVEREFHHPELTVTWGKVTVRTWTHTVGGLSENDFIIAARIDRL